MAHFGRLGKLEKFEVTETPSKEIDWVLSFLCFAFWAVFGVCSRILVFGGFLSLRFGWSIFWPYLDLPSYEESFFLERANQSDPVESCGSKPASATHGHPSLLLRHPKLPFTKSKLGFPVHVCSPKWKRWEAQEKLKRMLDNSKMPQFAIVSWSLLCLSQFFEALALLKGLLGNIFSFSYRLLKHIHGETMSSAEKKVDSKRLGRGVYHTTLVALTRRLSWCLRRKRFTITSIPASFYVLWPFPSLLYPSLHWFGLILLGV